jgi:hypothetical protein
MITRALLLATAVVVFAGPALAQQPAPELQREDETPTLTTDDVAPAPIAGQPAGAQTEAPPEDATMTPEERADAAASKPGAPGTKPEGKKGPSKAELAWRSRVAQAEAAERAARERAQQAELALTDMKNRMASASTVSERNSLAATVDQQGNAVQRAQEEATAAAATLKAIEAQGAANKYSRAAGPSPTTKSGGVNADYYLKRVAEAKAALDDATRRVQIYQDRVNEARGRSIGNSGSGDNFAQAKIQEDLDAALSELEKAQADRDAAQVQYDEATRAAQNANVALPRDY